MEATGDYEEEEGGGSKRPKQDEKKGTIKERGKGEEIIKSQAFLFF